jgi:GNAT superfamily N-acetyltransferase
MTGLIDELTRWLGHAEKPAPERFAARHLTSNGAAIAIRSGAPRDVAATVPMIEQICTLHRQWDAAKFGFIEGAVPMYRNWLAQRVHDPRSVFVVAAADGRLVAFAIGTTEEAAPIFRPARYGLIRDLWVEDEWRRHGIGRQILHAAIDRFRTIGITQIRLETAAANDAGRRFFASCGFRSSAVEMLLE